MFKKIPVKSGINIFVEKAVSAIIKEFNQLDTGYMTGKAVVQPIDSKLPADQDI